MPNDNSEEYISIGNLARSSGITTRTLRYYEEMGIMNPPWRVEGSSRIYTAEDVRKLKFILKLKELSAGHRKIILYANPGKEGFYKKLGFLPMRTAMAVFQNQEKAIEGGLVEGP